VGVSKKGSDVEGSVRVNVGCVSGGSGMWREVCVCGKHGEVCVCVCV